MIRPYSLIDALALTPAVLIYIAFFLRDGIENIATWRGPVGCAFGLGGIVVLVRVWSLLWAVP